MGSEQDPTWWDFPQALSETGGARRYVTLFEAPFQAPVLTDRENNALRAGSLMAIPPPPPGSQPLAGSFTIDLLGINLIQWASQVQEVASHMRWPPEAAVSCPQSDIIGVLDRLEGLTRVQYCRHCFGVGQQCQCSAIPHQAPGPMAALWMSPTVSYVAMVSSTETTASTSATGVTPLSHLPPGMPAIEPMDTLLAPTMENLLATTGVGWGHKPQTPLRMPAAPCLRQMRPQMPQQQAPTPRGQEATPAMPYQQQVFPPKRPAPKPSTTPSASQDHGDPAGEAKGARGRSSSQGPQNRQQQSRSSTRGSRKCRRGAPSNSLMDQMANYVASGWKRDLTHFIGCCWAVQIGSLDRDEWHVAITKFLVVMAKRKASEWMDIKELTPLQFMPYMAKLFKEVTGQDLQGLSQFTGWIGQGGYYHWRVVQQGLIHLVPHLPRQPMPRTPDAHPSGKPLPPKPTQTETPSTGASGKRPDRAQPAPSGSRQGSTPNQGGQPSTSGQGGMTTAPRQGRKSSTPCQSGEQASSSGNGTPAALGGPSNLPPGKGGAGDGTLRAYYTRVDPQTLSTWACQILCMIAEYHMACMTRGSPVTSPIVQRGLEECLPPLADYAPPED